MIFISLIPYIIIVIIFNLINLKSNVPGSDHPFHIGLIKAIKKNNHRFLLNYPYVIGEKNFNYPQFYHWILSFLPKKVWNKYYLLVNLFVELIGLILFYSFIITLYGFLNVDISIFYFSQLSLLIYVLTPFKFIGWNAKNTGVSGRSFGLILGQVLLYLLTFYELFPENNYWFWALVACSFVIIISSIFTTQFMFFTCFIGAALFSDSSLLLAPILALFIYLLLFRKIALNWIKGHYIAKKNVAKYLAPIFFLKWRYSIWRDFIWDFWILIFKKGKSSLSYILKNPVIEVIITIPFIAICIIYYFYLALNNQFNNEINGLFFTIISISIVAFVLTSFRKTRFLGEPQRYVEFYIPIISILVVILLFKTNLIYIIFTLIYSITLVLYFTLFKDKHDSSKNIFSSYPGISKKIAEYIIKNNNGNDNKLISNNFDLTKYFLEHEIPVLRPVYTSEKLSGVHFKDYHLDNNITLNPIYAELFISEFKLNWFIHDKNLKGEYSNLLNVKSLIFNKKLSIESMDLYEIEHKH